MSSTGNRASGASKRPSRRERIMTLTTARKMLPLIQRIVKDFLDLHKQLDKILPEQKRLERHRRDLSWPERRRRYILADEVKAIEKQLEEAFQELHQLGVAIIDAGLGRVGFPTLVNNRPAYFAWWPGEVDITNWHFSTESRCRTIPESWVEADNASMSGKT